jgi:hypothetical protein
MVGSSHQVGASSQLLGATDAASSAAACAALPADAAAVFCVLGSGRPAFCMAGFGRALARRRDSSIAGSMGRESAGRKGGPGGARTLFQERKRIAAQITAAAAKSNRKGQRRGVRFSGENIISR